MAVYDNLRERIHAVLHPARWGRWASLPASLLLGTLALGLATEVVAGPSAPPDTITPQLGRAVILSLPSMPSSVESADESVAAIDMLGPTRVVVRGVALGETEVTLRFAKGASVYRTVVGPAHALGEDVLRPTASEPVFVELPGEPTAVLVTNDKVARVSTGEDPTRLRLDAVGPGHSDLIVEMAPGNAPLIYAVQVE